MDVVSAEFIANLIPDGATVMPGGFGCCGHPDLLTESLANRFKQTGSPNALKLFFISGGGDKQGQGLDKLAEPGLLESAIGGFWGFCPALTEKVRLGEVEGHNWPLGVISKLLSEIASGSPGLLTKVGLGTFVDPDLEGGCMSPSTNTLLSKEYFRGEEYLFYPRVNIDFAMLRGTTSDQYGNITMEEEAAYHASIEHALAVKQNGGKVIVQVKEIKTTVNHHLVHIPGILVDYVVVEENNSRHLPSYGDNFSARSSHHKLSNNTSVTYKKIIANRASQEIPAQKVNINLGIGIPAIMGNLYSEKLKHITLTIESGVIGGRPEHGLSFGATKNPQAIISQSNLFSYYDGGGIDIAFLGFAEVDQYGRVNASKFGNVQTGAGGFINIAQAAKKIILCGSLTTKGLNISLDQTNKVVIDNEGSTPKFVKKVQQVTFDIRHSAYSDKEVLIITERAVFKLATKGMELLEIADGVTVKEIRSLIPFTISISNNLKLMNLTLNS